MGRMPGPRAHPTVKPLATMNRRNLKNWELRFGLTQLIVFVGLATGTMVVAFGLGYMTGEKVGLDTAQTRNLANAPRLPIESEDTLSGPPDETVSDVYAKLRDKPKAPPPVKETKEPAIDLSTIKTAEEAPVIDSLPAQPAAKTKAAVLEEPKEGVLKEPEEEQGGAVVKVLGGSASDKDTKTEKKAAAGSTESAPTLGALIPPSDNKAIKQADAVTPPGWRTIQPEEKLALKTEPSVKEQKTAVDSKKEKEESVKAAKEAAAQKAREDALVQAKETAKQKSVEEDSKAQIKTVTTESLKHGWYAQVAAPRKASDADDVARKLKSSGFSVRIEKADVRGEEYFRIMVGPEDSKDHADRLVQQLKRESYVRNDPFVRLVK